MHIKFVKRNHPLCALAYEFRPRKAMSVDLGTSSELLPLRYRLSEIFGLLGFSSAVQRSDSCKNTDLNYKLDIPGLPTFYRPMPRHTP
ncbi:hypothetical protein TNCV_3993481 [Trichonephila clavipes]|uniref:Uncharacterized protein n=1 Tax=Trichonephila clavipes TaxID=2585209 RepID=A0A8X6VPA4_TRICX|nr:hypothetical protein TNCV_3993481 [Trichonephila clavipes]